MTGKLTHGKWRCKKGSLLKVVFSGHREGRLGVRCVPSAWSPCTAKGAEARACPLSLQVVPPPNVTGALHIGHALTASIEVSTGLPSTCQQSYHISPCKGSQQGGWARVLGHSEVFCNHYVIPTMLLLPVASIFSIGGPEPRCASVLIGCFRMLLCAGAA